MQMIAGLVMSLLKGYLVKLATKEFAHWCFFKVAEAIVESTETKEDNEWLLAIKNTIEGKDLPES